MRTFDDGMRDGIASGRRVPRDPQHEATSLPASTAEADAQRQEQARRTAEIALGRPRKREVAVARRLPCQDWAF
ncbi:MAG: hypothetical protein AAGC81_02255 [Pseudomonadota bacterium]